MTPPLDKRQTGTFAREKSSFRDPSGFVFYEDGRLYRQVNRSYQANYEYFKNSGLEAQLFESNSLVKAIEEPLTPGVSSAIAVLRPETIPFISYPYEWSFSQLKDAALLTLQIQEAAMSRGMVLKDASAYNIQFLNGSPILIDSLSFEIYQEGAPWIAYGQFCRHFLAPLALMSYVDVRLGGLAAQYIDGVPLSLAAKLLPGMTKLKPALLTHIHVHSKAESLVAGSSTGSKAPTMSKTGMLALIDSLKGGVSGLQWAPAGTEWGDYYEATNYSEESMSAKHQMIAEAIDMVGKDGDSCWDLGANTGEFSRIAAKKGLQTVAWDIDPAAVEKNYLQVKRDRETNLLPLRQDLTNPSTGLGWMSSERRGMLDRGPADVVLALALIHHLAISNNVPLPMIAEMLGEAGSSVIVEFVPKEDSQVQRMLSHREDIFSSYDIASWRSAIEGNFETLAEWAVPGTQRTLFVLRKRG